MADPVSNTTTSPPADRRRRGIVAALLGTVVGWGFSLLGATVAIWTAGTARFLFPNILNEPPQRIKVGLPSDYPPGRVETRFKERFGIWLVHGQYQGQWQLYALRTVCTHLGCITIWQEGQQQFKCPCHGSGFTKDGINFEGPAPRALDRYAIRQAEDGHLEVDKTRTFQEELGQWTDPASYVSV